MKKITEPGIFDLSNEEYHQQAALNKSGLVQLSKSPAHFHEWYHSEEDEPTRAMVLGTAIHIAVLEPDRYDQSIIMAPQVDKRTKAGKEEWASFEKRAEGKIIINQDEASTIAGMKESVYNNRTAYDLLLEGVSEQSIFFKDPTHGFLCKARPDWYTNEREVVDLKTCIDAGYDGFSRAIANFKYHWQALFYLDGLTAVTGKRHKTFIFIAVEKEPPYAVAVYEATKDMLNTAQKQIAPILSAYAQCLKTDVWPGYKDKLQQIELPRWAA
ncbi:hypothetical protein D1BOALGB6SA_4899 [Olavius sp. associated proteobacterium Delta 1]|nr:hypothetical protein D1BOALGB6SA_4899 [Olavius sp. associated proteobacterium Delta 1]